MMKISIKTFNYKTGVISLMLLCNVEIRLLTAVIIRRLNPPKCRECRSYRYNMQCLQLLCMDAKENQPKSICDLLRVHKHVQNLFFRYRVLKFYAK